jgi:hypothetical protein
MSRSTTIAPVLPCLPVAPITRIFGRTVLLFFEMRYLKISFVSEMMKVLGSGR